jgi:hypothetical protein
MKTYLTTLFLLLSSCAFACDKIDYVEVRDWPVEQVEKALCDAREESLKLRMRQLDLQDSPYAREYPPRINACETQAALYVRVLENVHKRKLPNCKYK